MRIEFKVGIVRSGLTYRQIDEEMEWASGKTSATVSGAYNPSQEEREYLAAILGVSPCDIFLEIILTTASNHFPTPEAV